MKIVLIVPSFPVFSETFIVSKFLGLLDLGFDVHMVCSRSTQEEWENFQVLVNRPDIRKRVHLNWKTTPRICAALKIIPALISGFFQNPKATILYLMKGLGTSGIRVIKDYYLDRAIVLLQPDIVHFEFGALAVGRMELKERLGCKLAVSFRGHDLHFVELDNSDYYQNVWKNIDAVHCLGRELWEKALERGCSPNLFHRLISPAVDAQIFHHPDREYHNFAANSTRPLRILSVGRLHWSKGFEYALQSLRYLREAGFSVEYKIVGDGAQKDCVAYCIQEMKLDDCTVLLGRVSQQQTVDLMKWADIFLHAAVEEGFCNAVLEAQSMTLPIVCSDAGGLPENLVDEISGFIVPRREPKLMAEKVEMLASDSALAEKFGKAGRERVLKQFRIDQQIIAWENFYRDLIQSVNL